MKLSRIRGQCHRLILTRWPTVGPFDDISSAKDLPALIELEGWTNEHTQSQLGTIYNIPEGEWVFGKENDAHLVMAAFCHPSPDGSRFTGPERGAWYAGRKFETAIAETVFHHERRMSLSDGDLWSARMEMRHLICDVDAAFVDIRPPTSQNRALHHPNDYAKSQELGREVVAHRKNGIIYRSVRHKGGQCLAIFRPKLIPPVSEGKNYAYEWRGQPGPEISFISGPRKGEIVYSSFGTKRPSRRSH